MLKELKENTEVMLLPREAGDSVRKGWLLKRLCPKFNRNDESRLKQRKYLVVGRRAAKESVE